MSNAVQQVRSRVPRIAGAAVRRARLTVVPRPRTRAARVPFITLVTLLLVGGVVGLLLFNTSMQQASFAASALERQSTTLAAREQTLLLELENLRDPQRVARAAVSQGMVPARAAAFLRLSDGQVLGTPAVATPMDAVRIDALPKRRTGALVPERQTVRMPVPAVLSGAQRRDTAAGSPGTGAGAGRNGQGSGERGTQGPRADSLD